MSQSNKGSQGSPDAEGAGGPQATPAARPRISDTRLATGPGSRAAWLFAFLLFIALGVIAWMSFRSRPTNETSRSLDGGKHAADILILVTDAKNADEAAKKAVEDRDDSVRTLNEKVRKADEAASAAAAARAEANRQKAAVATNFDTFNKDAQGLEGKAADLKRLRDEQRLSVEKAALQVRAAEVAVTDAYKALRKATSEINPAFNWRLFWVLAPLLLGIFPLSAFAFWLREVPRLINQLNADYKMLGSERQLGASAEHQKIDCDSARWNADTYSVHCLLAVFVAAVGAALFCWRPESLLDINTQHGMQLGFLGAYVYCLNLVYRRYTTRDLQPHVYLYCAVGLIAGMIFNYVAFSAITNVANAPAAGAATAEFTGVGAAAAAILAFSLGYFPNMAVRWFGRLSRTSVHERQRRSDTLPLLLIDGISELHESRLQDEGIDNVQNLASADIKDLVAKTPYSAQEIVEWVDQALLYLYVDPGEIDSFRRAGVRSVTDFRDVWAGFSTRYKVQSDGTVVRIPPTVAGIPPAPNAARSEFDQRRKEIAAQLSTTEQRLDSLFLATEQGPNMDRVRTYWDNVQTASIQTRDLLVNQVCGRVGRALREGVREGSALATSDLLAQVAQGLFGATALSGKDEAVTDTAESLYGQAYLKLQLKEIAEARRLYRRCIEQFPEDPVAYNDLAWLELQTRSQRSDLRDALEFAEKAVGLTYRDKLKAEEAAKGAEATKEKKLKDGLPAEAEKAGIEQAAKQEEANKLAIDLAGYRDTLALAEIRVGAIEKGEKLALKAIEEWKNLGRGDEPRFVDTFVSAAAGYLAKGDRVNFARVLDWSENQKYASDATKKRIAELKGK